MSTEEDRASLSTEVSPQRHTSDGLVQVQVAAAEQRLTIGEKLSGRYRIERELGEGGMGVVYLVTDEQVVGETFAVKVLKEGLDPQALELLRGEVRKTRKLSHPNIVDVHSVNVDGSRLYVLMEYLEGKSLNALLDEEFGRGMPFSHAWPILEDVGAALGNAHDHNVIHSDLKPANIFVTNSGRTKLLDFGIARVSRGPLLQKRSGPLALTPAYASCEMLEGKEADRRDDIYSFACVIYEMLCGERPFGELSALEARERRAEVPSLGKLMREQNAALTKALAFKREARTRSVEELLAGLAAGKTPTRRSGTLIAAVVVALLVVLGLAYLKVEKFWLPRQVEVSAVPAFSPPRHSIAVLPFVNMSGDKEQEYFSDGLTEELLNSLAEINELQVAARTSAFSFKGTNTDIATIARKLNVGTVLEGSVRRSGNTVRVSTQLINAVTGFHLWSHTYDRDLGDVLKLETEIADAVAGALKVNLLGDEATKIELGGTRNPAAFDAYLRASKALNTQTAQSIQTAIAGYGEAIRLDPNYAIAFADRSSVRAGYPEAFLKDTAAIRDAFDKARADAQQAIALAPDLAEGHVALGYLFQRSLDFTQASQEYERAAALAPGSAQVLRESGRFAVSMGHFDAGLAAVHRAVTLDPLNPRSHYLLGLTLFLARRYDEALAAHAEAITLDSNHTAVYALRGLAYYELGNLESARASCETKPTYWASQLCLAVTYDKLGRRADAEAELAKIKAAGDGGAYSYAAIYAQWGGTAKALEWLETAMRLHNPRLQYAKTDPLMDPLRKEPRFQAIERDLKFPQ